MKKTDTSIAYCSNFWTHHQAPVCAELDRLLKENCFKLCLFEPVHDDRQKQGWAGETPEHSWIAGPPISKNDLERLTSIICGADVAVLGACPEAIKAARIETGKLTFIMSERLMRNGFLYLRMLNPRFTMRIRRLRYMANRPHVHYLAIGQHAAADAKILNIFGERIWRWAYFVSPTKATFRQRTGLPVRILWAGRFLPLKRVDMILRAMAALGSGIKYCSLELIGDGPSRTAMECLAKRLCLGGRVHFSSPTSTQAVRDRMADADIYVFPSNHLEGWGAVVGEAMTEGCVVVASSAAGASKVLIDNGRTGFVFADGDLREFTNILRQVIENSEVRRIIGHTAAAHMRECWHPRLGAERLLKLSQGLLRLAPMPENQSGPCSSLSKG